MSTSGDDDPLEMAERGRSKSRPTKKKPSRGNKKPPTNGKTNRSKSPTRGNSSGKKKKSSSGGGGGEGGNNKKRRPPRPNGESDLRGSSGTKSKNSRSTTTGGTKSKTSSKTSGGGGGKSTNKRPAKKKGAGPKKPKQHSATQRWLKALKEEIEAAKPVGLLDIDFEDDEEEEEEEEEEEVNDHRHRRGGHNNNMRASANSASERRRRPSQSLRGSRTSHHSHGGMRRRSHNNEMRSSHRSHSQRQGGRGGTTTNHSRERDGENGGQQQAPPQRHNSNPTTTTAARNPANPGDPRGANPAPPPFSQIIANKHLNERVSDVYDPDDFPHPAAYLNTIDRDGIDEEEGVYASGPQEPTGATNARNPDNPGDPRGANPAPPPFSQIEVGASDRVSELYDPEDFPPASAFEPTGSMIEENEEEEDDDDEIFQQIELAKQKAKQNAFTATNYNVFGSNSPGVKRPSNQQGLLEQNPGESKEEIGRNKNNGLESFEDEITGDDLDGSGNMWQRRASLQDADGDGRLMTYNNKNTQWKMIQRFLYKWCRVFVMFLGVGIAFAYTVNLLAFAVAYATEPIMECDAPLRYIWELNISSWCLDVAGEVAIQVAACFQKSDADEAQQTGEQRRGLNKMTCLFGLFSLACKLASAGIKIGLMVYGIEILVYEICWQSPLFIYVANFIVLGSILFFYQFIWDVIQGYQLREENRAAAMAAAGEEVV